MEFSLSDDEKRILLETAREAVASALERRPPPPIRKPARPPKPPRSLRNPPLP